MFLKRVIYNIPKALFMYIGLVALMIVVAISYYFLSDVSDFGYAGSSLSLEDLLTALNAEESLGLVGWYIIGMPVKFGIDYIVVIYLIPYLPVFVIPLLLAIIMTISKKTSFSKKVFKFIFWCITIIIIIDILSFVVFYAWNTVDDIHKIKKFQKRHLLNVELPVKYNKIESDLKDNKYGVGNYENCAVQWDDKNRKYCLDKIYDYNYDKIVDYFYIDNVTPHKLSEYIVLYDNQQNKIINKDPFDGYEDMYGLVEYFIVFDKIIYLAWFDNRYMLLDKANGKILYDSDLLNNFNFNVDWKLIIDKQKIIDLIRDNHNPDINTVKNIDEPRAGLEWKYKKYRLYKKIRR